MNDILFTRTMTAEQLASQKKLNWFVAYVFLPLCLLCLLVIFGEMVLLLRTGIDEEMKNEYILLAIMFLSVLLMLFLCVYLAKFIIEFPRMNKDMFDILANKQFSYSPSINRLTYTDPKRSFTFAGTDVVKWVSGVMAKGATTDILRLQNGEQIVLESKFNPDVHFFLHEYRHVLQLPDPKPMTMVINYYRNPI